MEGYADGVTGDVGVRRDDAVHLNLRSTLHHVPDREAQRSTSKTARVAHIVLALKLGGLERMVLRLLERTDRRRFTLSVCALDEPGELACQLSKLRVPLTVFGRKPGIDFELAFRLAMWMERERIDLIHTHNAGPHFYGALAAGLVRLWRRRGPRILHTKHGVGMSTSTWQPRLNHFSSWLSDRVVAVSSEMHEFALTADRVEPSKLITVLNGVDPYEFSPGGNRKSARMRLGVPQGGMHVGCVARLSPVKDHATMIEAFARLKAKRPDVHLTLVGDGSTRAELVRKVAWLGLDQAVTFAGSRLDIPEILPAFDVFALSSLTEGASLTLMEAAAAGLPIVATRVGGNSEIVEEQKSGILVPPRDPDAFSAALYEVLSRPNRERMGIAGRTRVLERFSIDGMAQAYQSLYAELLAL